MKDSFATMNGIDLNGMEWNECLRMQLRGLKMKDLRLFAIFTDDDGLACSLVFILLV